MHHTAYFLEHLQGLAIPLQVRESIFPRITGQNYTAVVVLARIGMFKRKFPYSLPIIHE